MSAKDCGNHGYKRKKIASRIFACFLAFIIAVLFVILLVWLILRPTKPHFTLQDATVYQFNLSSPGYLSSNIQVTIASRNPNDRIGVYYDKLDVFASYRNQQITMATIIPSAYQGHNDVLIWSPSVIGNSVPVSPMLSPLMTQDQTAGVLLVNIKIQGRVRWKVGTWISGRYHLFVNCPAYLTFGSKFSGINVGGAVVKYQLDRDCSTDV